LLLTIALVHGARGAVVDDDDVIIIIIITITITITIIIAIVSDDNIDSSTSRVRSFRRSSGAPSSFVFSHSPITTPVPRTVQVCIVAGP
jgi:hypothetical protein